RRSRPGAVREMDPLDTLNALDTLPSRRGGERPTADRLAEAAGRLATRLRSPAPLPPEDRAGLLGEVAEVRIAQGRHAEAESLCREALRLDPEGREARERLGVALAYLGEPSEAALCLAQAPDRPMFLTGRALAHQQLGSLGEAESDAR